MPAQTELDRLAAARPPLLDRSEVVVDPVAEDQILRRILATPPARDRTRTSRRPQALRPATAIAAAAAVAAVAGGSALIRSEMMHPPAPPPPGSGHHMALQERLPADQVMAALAAKAVDAASRRYILYVRTVYAPGTTVGGTAVMESWTKGISDREKLFGASGAILNDVSAVISHGMRVRRFVDYTSRTWQTDSIALGKYGSAGPPGQRMRQLLMPHAMQRPKVPGAGSPDDPSRTITTATVRGKRMILVTFTYPRPLSSSGGPDFAPLFGSGEMLPAAAGRHNAALAQQIWISATSYLPVRAEVTATGGRVLVAMTYDWLSASQANRAMLSPAPVPAGFRLTAELAH